MRSTPKFLKSGLVLALGSAAPLLCRWHGGSFRGKNRDQLCHYFFRYSAIWERLPPGIGCCTITRPFRWQTGLFLLRRQTVPSSDLVTKRCPISVFSDPIERHDPDGALLLTNFALEICGAKADWRGYHH